MEGSTRNDQIYKLTSRFRSSPRQYNESGCCLLSNEVYDFGYRLKRLREDRGLSQAALAKKLGVSKETVYRYEHNVQDPSLERAKQLALILRTSADYLLGLENSYTIKLPKLTEDQHKALIEFLRAFTGN